MARLNPFSRPIGQWFDFGEQNPPPPVNRYQFPRNVTAQGSI
jgi:hypothetical protein